MYNIAKADGTLMLGLWVKRLKDVRLHLHHYQKKYRPGAKYPNGKGVYPDFGFRIVTETEHTILLAQIQLDKIFYQLGKLPPRYPVPAIIYDVYLQVTPNYPTEIWERTGTQYDYNKRVYVYNAR